MFKAVQLEISVSGWAVLFFFICCAWNCVLKTKTLISHYISTDCLFWRSAEQNIRCYTSAEAKEPQFSKNRKKKNKKKKRCSRTVCINAAKMYLLNLWRHRTFDGRKQASKQAWRIKRGVKKASQWKNRLYRLSREALSAQSLALRSPLMTSPPSDCLPRQSTCFTLSSQRDVTNMGCVEHVGGRQSIRQSNDRISLPIIFDSMSPSSPSAFGGTMKIDRN